MSADLPPDTAPFADKLRVAMERAGYSQRALGLALGTDGSLVGKWLKGAMPSDRHLRELPRLLDTPADYFSEQPRADLLEELVETVAQLGNTQKRVLRDLDDARTRLALLEAESERRPASPKRPRKQA